MPSRCKIAWGIPTAGVMGANSGQIGNNQKTILAAAKQSKNLLCFNLWLSLQFYKIFNSEKGL